MQVGVKLQTITVENIMSAIASKIDSAAFKSWILPLEINLVENNLNLIAENQFSVDYIKSLYLNTIQEIANQFNLNLSITKKTSNKTISANDNVVSKFEVKTEKKSLENSAVFNKFVVCDENSFVMSACKKMASGAATFSPLYLYGPLGCGKTLLAECIRSESTGKTVYLTGSQFVSEFVRALRENSIFAFKDFCRNCDTFILDNVNEVVGKRSHEELLQLLLDLRERNIDIVITSNTSPSNMSGFDKRLSSFFASGLTADIVSPTANVKKTMLVRSGVALDVAEMLAGRINSDGHLISGVAKKINTYSQLMNEKVTKTIAEKLLSDTLEKTKTPLSMVQTMCEKLGVSYDEVCGRGRSKTIVRARQIMMYSLKLGTKLSLTEIGRLCGDRDHATVLYALSQIEKLKSSDLIVSAQISQMVDICR